jgi:hypothetical protein
LDRQVLYGHNYQPISKANQRLQLAVPEPGVELWRMILTDPRKTLVGRVSVGKEQLLCFLYIIDFMR